MGLLIHLFTLMRIQIRIQLAKKMRIHADADLYQSKKIDPISASKRQTSGAVEAQKEPWRAVNAYKGGVKNVFLSLSIMRTKNPGK
jgi:hypothetical protein